MFDVGDTVRCINADQSDDKLAVGVCYVVLSITLYEIGLKGVDGYWDYTRFEPASLPQGLRSGSAISLHDLYSNGALIEQLIPIAKVKCECGVDSIGGGRHSDYCPKHEY